MSVFGADTMTAEEYSAKARIEWQKTFDKRLAALMVDPSDENASDLLIWFESGKRPEAFLAMHKKVFPRKSRNAGHAFWRWVAMAWTTFDAIPHFQYEQAFHRWGDYWSADFISNTKYAANRDFYDNLPDTGITVYRGQDENDDTGLSWTTDMNVAQGFARGHRGLVNDIPTVVEAVIAKKDIALTFIERNESEIVLFCPDSAEIIDYYTVGK